MAVIPMVASLMLAFVAVIGLVADGGAVLRGGQKASAVAAEAGRTAGQQVDEARVLSRGEIRGNRTAALSAARRYLRANGYRGDVSFTRDGTRIRVTAEQNVSPVFLGAIGFDDFTVTGESTIDMVAKRGSR